MSKWRSSIKVTQAEVEKLIPALRIGIRPRPLKLSRSGGRKDTLSSLSVLVTAVIKEERVEHTFTTLSEARNYVERLISEAVQHGDKHEPTMRLANFWIRDKQAVHKLFKVLVPRYENSNLSYTKMYKAPIKYPGHPIENAVLELRNNPLIPVMPRPVPTRNWINNVLLEEARKEYAQAMKQQAMQQQDDTQHDEVD